jgi:putative N-acetylmannosamine-6-phosphate epimerase
MFGKKMENKKYQTVRKVLKSNGNIIEKGKFDTPKTHIHDR